MARRWIKFAHGQAPWKAFTLKDQIVAVVDGPLGWMERTREVDERLSKKSEEGQRRYQAWEILDDALRKLDNAPRLQAVEALGIPHLGRVETSG